MTDEKTNLSETGRWSRRRFLQAGLSGSAAAAAFAARPTRPLDTPSLEIAELGIDELQAGLDSGRFTARGLVEQYLDRVERLDGGRGPGLSPGVSFRRTRPPIQAMGEWRAEGSSLDRRGPALRAVIETNPDSLSEADALDRERKAGALRGPLHGVPLLIKDNIDTADGMATTAGSLALIGARPPRDAFLVQRLRRAGAVLLGKTNLSEWANIRSPRSTSGWSGRGGLTLNPYALDRNTSGSSSGSAAAVAAGLCAAAVGTETDGSIVSPASLNGIVGLKPTVGLISRAGVIPISATQDTAGPMARTVRDAAILLGALAGVDPEDPATEESRGRAAADYTKTLDPAGLRGARIGVVRRFFGLHRGVDALMEQALAVLKARGAVLVDPAEIETWGRFDEAETTVFLYELKAGLKAYLARLGPASPVHSLAEIIAFNERRAAEEMPYFGQETFLKAEAKGPLTEKEYLDAWKLCRRMSRREGIDAVMEAHRLDALVAPTDGPAWVTDLVLGDHFLISSSTAAAVAGYPSITVPAGAVFGLPVGISFFGRAWSEPALLRLAYAFEQATHHRRPPRFLPTADLRA
jgi:amidase